MSLNNDKYSLESNSIGGLPLKYLPGAICPYVNKIASVGKKSFEWGKNSARYVYFGGLPSMEKTMKIPGTESYYSVKSFPVAHKPFSIAITDPKITEENLLEDRDGQRFSGGAEFHAIGSVIGEHNPLIEKNPPLKKKQKSFALNQHFGAPYIAQQTVNTLHFAKKFIDRELNPTEKYDTFNITRLFPQYTVQNSMKIILDIDPDNSGIPDVIGLLENIISDWILYHARSIIPAWIDTEKTRSRESLEEVSRNIMDQSEEPQSFIKKMKTEKRYSSSHIKKMEMTKQKIKEDSSPESFIKSIVTFLSNQDYREHFFELVNQKGYEFSNVAQLLNMEHDQPENYEIIAESITKSGELDQILEIITQMIVEKDREKFLPEHIIDMIKTILVIGSGTTKSGLISAVYCLLKYPKEQEKLFRAFAALNLSVPESEEWESLQELTLIDTDENTLEWLKNISEDLITPQAAELRFKVIKDTPLAEFSEEDFDFLKKLKINTIINEVQNKLKNCEELNQFLDEVLRYYPPIPVQPRTTLTEIEINGETIPPGTTLFFANIFSWRDETRWPDPHKFDPSRFADKSKLVQKTFPFGMGTNQCMGRFQAMATLKSFIYQLVMNFKIHPPLDNEGQNIEQSNEIEGGLTLKFIEDKWVRLERRNS